MEKKNSSMRAGFSTILWGVLAVLLCAAPCGARTVASGETLNVGTGYPDEQILGDWLDVYGTVNMYPGAYIEYGLYAYAGSTVNIRGGGFGSYGYLTIIGATGPDEKDPVVTIYGTDFHVGSDYYQPCSPYLISGVTLEGYYDDGKTMPISLWISADAPIFLAPPGGCVKTVEIDIKPGSDPNPINPGSNGLIPVAILTTDDFNAADVNSATVTLAGAKVAVRGKAEKLMARLEDIDGDGDLDLLVQVETQSDGELWESGTVTLTGKTYDGQDIKGTDEVIIVPAAE